MPRMGELTAAQVWAATTRTLSAFNYKSLVDRGGGATLYPGVLATSSATPNTFGSWVQVSADIGTGKVLRGLSWVMNSVSGGDREIEVGEGASGSEAAVERVGVAFDWDSAAGYRQSGYIPLWKKLTDSARIAVRVRVSEAVAVGLRITLDVV